MKKLIILAGLLLTMAHTAFAGRQGVCMQFYRRLNPEKSKSINRAPMRLPIEVVYDSDTHKIEVFGEEDMDVQIYLCDENGNILNYSPSINTVLDIPDSIGSLLNIRMESDSWYATANITISNNKN